MTSLIIPADKLAQYYRLHSALVDVLFDALSLWPGGTATVTSIYRTPQEDARLGGSGIHASGPPYRAADLVGLDTPQYEAIADALNHRWIYDPDRPGMGVALGKPHGTGPHLHLQVHPATKRSGGF